MNGIYRIEPKEEDSSMKRLDKMITVTSPSLWLILLGGVVIVAAVLVWSCTGRMTETVDATGLYHPSASEYGEVIAMLPWRWHCRCRSGWRCSRRPMWRCQA